MKLKDIDFDDLSGFDLYVNESSEEVFMGSFNIDIKPINGNDELFIVVELESGNEFFSLETDCFFDGQKVMFKDNNDYWSLHFFKTVYVDLRKV